MQKIMVVMLTLLCITAENNNRAIAEEQVLSRNWGEIFSCPDVLKRSEFVVWLVHSFGILPTEQTTDPPYTDVLEDAWFYSELKVAYDNELIQGTGKSIFSPHEPITREEALTIMGRLLKTAKETYEWKEASEWAKSSFNALYEQGIISSSIDKGNFSLKEAEMYKKKLWDK